VAGAALPAFQKEINHRKRIWRISKPARWPWPVLKTGELALAGFQKLSAQLQKICCPIGGKDLNSPVLKARQGQPSGF